MNYRILAAVLVCLPASLAPATTFRKATTGDLVLESQRVCCAVCERVEARVDPRSGIVFTHVRLRLLEDIKGASSSSTIQLRIVGGRVGNVATVVAGMPRFTPGRESVVLLGRPNRDGFPVVMEASRGVLPLARDTRGQRFVQRRVTGIEELKGRRRVTLDEFRGAVRRLVRERKERAK